MKRPSSTPAQHSFFCRKRVLPCRCTMTFFLAALIQGILSSAHASYSFPLSSMLPISVV